MSKRFLYSLKLCGGAIALMSLSACFQRAAHKDKIAKVAEPAPVLDLSPHETHARLFFRKNKYHAAILALEHHPLSLDGHLIKGESYFRLGEMALAKPHFEHIYKEALDNPTKRKAAIRLFDIEIKRRDLKASVAAYVVFQKEFTTPTAGMRYALGKTLYDEGHSDKAKTVLGGIKKGNEYFGRARYIIAAISIDDKDLKKSIRVFGQIEKLTPVAVEDYAVKQMAILAQARLLVEAGREDLAAKAYQRVVKEPPFGDVAMAELVRSMVRKAKMAQMGVDRYQKASPSRRELAQREALDAAQNALDSYQKAHIISWRTPELLSMTASLMIEVGRYEDARLLLDELSNHYRTIDKKLQESGDSADLWSFLKLDFSEDNKSSYLILGVPDNVVRDLPQVKEILSTRDKIEHSHRVLLEQLEIAHMLKLKSTKELEKAQSNQVALEDAYQRMVQKKQVKLNKNLREAINKTMAESEFLRAHVVERQMADIKKQIGAAQAFQNEKIDLFENKLKEIDEGASP